MSEGDTAAARPRLRMLEAFPLQHDGQRLIGLRDPAGFTNSVAEMQDILAARHGERPTVEQILALVERLDAAGFLDSERFAARRRAIEEAFRASPVREAIHAGAAYASEPDALREQVRGFFAHVDGPGAHPPSIGPGARGLRGLLAPHIDFHRGGPTYAWAYRELLARTDADLFVILGTCHVGMEHPFAVTLKPFETPLGTAPVDRDFFEGLQRRAGQDLLASELAHRGEHSVELQAVMLRAVLGERPFTILPVLASFLHEAVLLRRDPEADPRIPRFIDALLETMAASRRKVCLIGGVDLAHVGPRFGDPEPNTAESLRAVEAADRSMLEAVTAGDPTAFFASVAADQDARRICGLSPIYAFVRALPGVEGRLLRYSQWPDPEGAVSFCAAAFP
jgi:AmmeMemoRadiSam system protein B